MKIIRLNCQDIIKYTIIIITAVSYYFSMEKRISILELHVEDIKKNQSLWIKQISHASKIWHE